MTSTAPQGRGEQTLVPAEVVELRDVVTFEGFYQREMPGLVLLARALSGSASADDIAQDAMLAAYRRWGEVKGYASPVGWVRRVCANTAVSAVRRRGVETRALLRLGGERQKPDDLPFEVEEFWSEVRRLPRRQAQSVALFYLYGLTVAEVASTLGCSEGSVKVHLTRGRAALAKRLGDSVEEPSP